MTAHNIDRVTVLGLGIMGHGIAQSFAIAGCTVRCFDELPSARTTLSHRVRGNLQQLNQAGLIDNGAIDPTLERLTVLGSEVEAIRDAQFVAEVVREDLTLKQELFARVESSVSRQCILVSNTSTFPMTQIATRLIQPERAVNTHWFNPPHIVPVVEVVPGEKTSQETIQTTMALLDRIGKLPILLNLELAGFLVNRVQMAMMREVLDLMERGVASPEDIDRAIRGSMGLRLAAFGPLQVWDFAGLDVCARVYEHLATDVRSDRKLPSGVKKIIEGGNFGFKTGKGVYEYPAESREGTLAERDRRYLSLLKLFFGERKVG